MCDRPVLARGYCSRHYQKWLKYGNPLEPNHRGENLPTDQSGTSNSNYRGSKIGYSMAHHRVEAARGKAAEHECADCGAPASTWSYDHEDPTAKYDARRDAYFSVDISHYVARCRGCHTSFDTNRKRGNKCPT